METLIQILTRHGFDPAGARVHADTDRGPLVVLPLTSPDPIVLWRRLHDLAGETGHLPLFLGDEEDLRVLLDNFAHSAEQATAEIIRQSQEIDLDAWVANRPWHPEDERLHIDVDALVPTPAHSLQIEDFSSLTDEDGTRHDGLQVALVPAAAPHLAPAVLRFGGWNECPEDAVHVAFLRHWAAAYGAEPVAMTCDMIELAVSRPVTDPVEAAALAKVHFAYCPDLVYGCGHTLQHVAQSLLGSPTWSFWWD